MKRILLTGANGDVARQIKPLLKSIYSDLQLSDIELPRDIRAGERFVTADLTNLEAVEEACAGVDGIVHLGGYAVEGPWEQILAANIVGTYNLFEAARRQRVRRIVFASSNHVMGFHPRHRKIGVDVVPRPDTRYGVSKLFGEGIGALYAYKYGIGVLSVRIGNIGEKPLDKRRLAIWISPEDFVRLIRVGLERADLVYEVVYGMSDNRRAWWDNSRALEIGYHPQDQAEIFAKEVLRAERKESIETAGSYFQGGKEFCNLEFEADLERLRKLS